MIEGHDSRSTSSRPALGLASSCDIAAEVTSAGDGSALIAHVESILESARLGCRKTRPIVTLTYAQSLDGCISADAGVSTAISSQESRVFTHRLRAMHDAILVGVNTVLVDDPRLNVREVEGRSPRPIVMDSRLRTPPDARLFRGEGASPIIATVAEASELKELALKRAGAEVLRVSASPHGGVDLARVLEYLRGVGIRSVMVEGGATIITRVFSQNLADQLVLTISPMVLGGLRAVQPMVEVLAEMRPRLENMHCEVRGADIILQGEFERKAG